MSWFRTDNSLGVDVGTASVKVVELERGNNGPRLATYGLIELESNVVSGNDADVQPLVSRAIMEICKQARVQSKRAVSSLPGFSVFTSLINLPKMTDKELSEAIKYEAKRHVPVSLENMVLDWKVVNTREVTTKEGLGSASMQVLLTAAPKPLVNRYVSIFQKTDLKLAGLETEAFALARSLIGNDRTPTLVLDIGSSATDVIVVTEGLPILSRTMEVGGKILTQTIAQSLNVGFARAEQSKRDLGIRQHKQPLSPAIQSVLHRIVGEVQNTLKLYYAKQTDKITKIVLTGGASQLGGLSDYLEEEIKVKTFIGNPWARISYPQSLSSTLQEIGSNFAVAIGLAMREMMGGK